MTDKYPPTRPKLGLFLFTITLENERIPARLRRSDGVLVFRMTVQVTVLMLTPTPLGRFDCVTIPPHREATMLA